MSLYIHIPFCVQKCHYCGFYSTTYTEQLADEFIACLSIEASRTAPACADRIFESVYIGGGTPTTLSVIQLAQIIEMIKTRFTLSESAEVTLEANPNTATVEFLGYIRDCGINRLSIGVQSFSDRILSSLGRPHDAAQALSAVDCARKAGIANINVDLIYAIPGQTMDDWTHTLNKVISLCPQHISLYSLSLDENSQYYRDAISGKFSLPEDTVAVHMYEYALVRLTEAGFRRYEISNFSLPGFECRHNVNYWERGEYVGLGPAASSFVAGRRYHTVADIHEYCGMLRLGLPVISEEEILSTEESATEVLMLGLRTTPGLNLSRYADAYGSTACDHLMKNAVPFLDQGYLEMLAGRLRLTDRGIMLSNHVLTGLSS